MSEGDMPMPGDDDYDAPPETPEPIPPDPEQLDSKG